CQLQRLYLCHLVALLPQPSFVLSRSITGGWRRHGRESFWTDAEALRRQLTPILIEKILESNPCSLSRCRRILLVAVRLPPHEVEAKEFAIAIAIVDQTSFSPEPTLWIIHRAVEPAFRA